MGSSQRIRVLTPLQHSALQRALQRGVNNDGSCVRGSVLTSVTQTLHRSELQTSVQQRWQLCQRIRSADSL
jgi:hypothetical protein